MRHTLWKCLRGAGIGLLALSGAVSAATISGYVREKGSRESMPYVSVYLEGLRIGAMTNTSGYYVINGVPPGEHTLMASLVGYNDFKEQISVGSETVVKNIELETEVIEIQAVEVQAERVKAPSLEIIPSRETLRGVELKVAPAAVEADPIRTLQTLPGVVQLSDFNTGLYVRGGTPDQNLILVDGSELYNVSHFFGLFSTFPADAIKSTELLMGGYPAQYGGRLSSVLNVTTDEGNKEKFCGIGGISLLSSRLTMQGPLGPGSSFLLSGRRTYLEPVLRMAGLDAMGYYFYDFQGKFHKVLSHEDQFSVAGYAGKDKFSYKNDFINTLFDWGNMSASFAWTHLFSPTFYSHYQFNVSRFQSHTKFKIEDLGISDDNRLFDVDAKADFTWFADDRNTIETGAHLKRHGMRFGEELGSMSYEAFDISAYVPSAYVQDSWRPWPFLTLQPGLRGSFFRATNASNKAFLGSDEAVTYSSINPRLTVRYQLGEDTFIKGAVGRYTQYLFRVPREFYGVSLLSDLWFTCDTSAGPQYAWHYILGFETKVGEDITLTAEWYYKDYKDLAEFNYAADAPQSAGDALVRGNGYAYGMDLSLKKRAGRHMGWISYALAWTVRDFPDLNKDEFGKAEPFYPKYDSRHHIDAVYSYEITKHWTLNSRFSFATGQGYTKTLGRAVIQDPVYTFDPISKDRLNVNRLPYYMRLDVGIRGSFQKWGVKWMPFLQIVNLFNRKNEFARYWTSGDPMKDPPELSKEESVPQLPFLPTIGLDLEF